MKFRIQVLRVADDGAERMKEVMEFERQELVMETLGMSLAEGKAVLKGVQEFVAEQQAAEFLQRERTCRNCDEASVEQRRRFDFSAHGVRASAAAEPTLESVRLSVDRERDLSARSKAGCGVAARPAKQWGRHCSADPGSISRTRISHSHRSRKS
jgi:hypothetical protein